VPRQTSEKCGFNGLHVGFAESRIWQPDIKEVRDTRTWFYSETIHDLETKEVDSETNHVSETQAERLGNSKEDDSETNRVSETKENDSQPSMIWNI